MPIYLSKEDAYTLYLAMCGEVAALRRLYADYIRAGVSDCGEAVALKARIANALELADKLNNIRG